MTLLSTLLISKMLRRNDINSANVLLCKIEMIQEMFMSSRNDTQHNF